MRLRSAVDVYSQAVFHARSRGTLFHAFSRRTPREAPLANNWPPIVKEDFDS